MRCDNDAGMANGEVKLDFLLDVPAHYFKSSFARAMISDSRSPRSLDTAIAAEIWARDSNAGPTPSRAAKGLCTAKGGPRTRGTPQVATICKLNQKAARSPAARDDVTLTPASGPASLPPTDMQIQRPRKERAPTPPSVGGEERRGRAPLGAASPGPASVASMASGASTASGASGSLGAARETALLLDTARLQSQVDTLAWQLRQTEASRQMYRRLMGQVVQFLERAHRSLDAMRDKPVQGRRAAANANGSGRVSPASEHAYRVPRSRSVHTMAAPTSRVASPPRPDAPSPLSGRAKSVAHMEDASGASTPLAPCAAYRDFTWRRPRKQQIDPECVPPEKLSEESFRLLRLVQSLLSVQEPDLAQRISSDTSSINSSTLDHLPDRSYPNSIGQRSSTASSGLDIPDDKGSVLELTHSFNKKLSLPDTPAPLSLPPCSPVSSSCSRILSSADTMSIHSVHSTSSKNAHSFKNSPLTSGLESGFAGHARNNPSTPSPPLEKEIEQQTGYNPSTSTPKQQLSEDESGFSSMSSFQEVGVPIGTPPPLPSSPPPSGSFQEIGLPIVETPTNTPIPTGKHRRWSSVPVGAQTHFPQHNQSFCLPQESLRVLWV